MLELLKEEQPVFLEIIKNAQIQGKVPHAYLLIGENNEESLSFLTMSLLCDQPIACGTCDTCRKVKNGIHSDILIYDGKKESIKKENIQLIQKRFMKSSLEGKGKIYILKNIEKSSKSAMNTLLKMLEEPEGETYAIFTSNNINRVLPTIVSRCQTITLKPFNKKSLRTRLVQENIELAKANILCNLVSTYEQAIACNDEKLDELILQAINTTEDLFLNKENLLINVHVNVIQEFKEKEDIKRFLQLFTLALKDVYHLMLGDDCVFITYENQLRALTCDKDLLLKRITLVAQCAYRLEGNVNTGLQIESLLINL